MTGTVWNYSEIVVAVAPFVPSEEIRKVRPRARIYEIASGADPVANLD